MTSDVIANDPGQLMIGPDGPRLPDLEAWLDKHHITWRLDPALDITTVDAITGLANQARFTPLDEDAVDRYTADMEAGDVFPPIVLNHLADDTLVPVGGNHRLAAATRARLPTIAAYVLDNVDADLVHLLALEDNRRHGVPLSTEERLWHAVELHQSGHTIADAAAACGVAVQSVTRQPAANRATKRAIRLDIDGAHKLSASTRARLDQLSNDKVFTRAVGLVVDGSVLASEVGKFVSTLNGLDTSAALEELSRMEVRSAHRTRRGGGRPPSYGVAPRRRMMSDLDGLLTITPSAVLADCDTDLDRRQLHNQIKATARHLMAIDKALVAASNAAEQVSA